jgi:hypothetical protein
VSTLRSIVREAICWAAFSGDGAVGEGLDGTRVVDQVINVLRRDPRFPRLPRDDYEMLLGDVRRDLDEALDRAFEDMVGIDCAIDAAVEALIEHADETQAESEQAP